LYAIVLKWSDNGRIIVKSLGRGTEHAPKSIDSVKLLGSDEKIQWNHTQEGLLIDATVSGQRENPVTLAITCSY
jgi:alpha-L-fucosidase